MRPSLLLALSLLVLAGCSGGNLGAKSSSLSGPAAPPVLNPLFDPHAPPGSVPAAWVAPVFDYNGTIVRPNDPMVQGLAPAYERAPWIAGGQAGQPAGTY